jgi:glycosyltransferase involved in cell wall biosynthesis
VLSGAAGAAAAKRRRLPAQVALPPGWAEAIGAAPVEAMSCAGPVLGTAAGGVREPARDGGDGRLLPPRNPGAGDRASLGIADPPEPARARPVRGQARGVASCHVGGGAEVLLREIGLRPRTADDVIIPDRPAPAGRRSRR